MNIDEKIEEEKVMLTIMKYYKAIIEKEQDKKTVEHYKGGLKTLHDIMMRGFE